MLVTQLPQNLGRVKQRSLSLSSMSTASFHRPAAAVTRQQSRTFWGWRRGDYACNVDPMFYRLARYRTLKTRAKLLDKARRRGRWEWDASEHPFFSQRHIRLASHWNGIGRTRYPTEAKPEPEKKNDAESAGDDEFELSRRELEWKEQMDAMRKRIEHDTYEAVFGKRFEPFWNPLLPSWMRSDESSKSPKAPETPIRSSRHVEAEHNKSTSKSVQSNDDAVKKDADNESTETPNGQLTNYSYSSSTSWDSWTNKARRQEWDSLSGQTRHFEYDPISNRMVKVEVPKTKEQRVLPKMEASEKKPQTVAVSSAKQVAVDIPITKSDQSRKAIPVPTQSQEPKTSVHFPSLINTAVVKSTTSSPPISREFEQDLDMLTPEDVRASIGKAKKEHNNMDVLLDTYGAERKGKDNSTPAKSQWEQAEELVMLERELDKLNVQRQNVELVAPTETKQTSTPLESALDRMQSKELWKNTSADLDDSAAHESTGNRVDSGHGYMPKDWEKQADLLQAERVRRTSDAVGMKSRPQIPRWIDEMNARKREYELKKSAEKSKNAARDAKLAKVNAMLEEEVEEQKRQMLSHEMRAKSRRTEPSQTEDGEKYRRKNLELRSELDMNIKESSQYSQMQVERIRELAELTAKLQAENQKYQRKTAALRKELDESFKQSSVGAEMHVDRIRGLEKELEKTKSSLQSSSPSSEFGKNDVTGKSDRPELSQAEGDFCTNITKFAKDSNKWYKRPANPPAADSEVAAQISKESSQRQRLEQREKDRALVNEVKSIYEGHYGPIDRELRQAASESAIRGPIPKVVDVEQGDLDLGSALGEYESQKEYGFRRAPLAAEVAQEENSVYEALAENDRRLAQSSNVVSHISPSPIAKPGIQWQDPPVYKVLAYDSGNDIITTVETSSNFTDAEAPISIPQALSQLYQPSSFVSHFAELQKQNFQVIHATNDLLVFKKIKTAADKTSTKPAVPETTQSGFNPIDGMSSRSVLDEPETVRFASPTGFVGDRWDAFTSPDGQQTDYTRTFEPHDSSNGKSATSSAQSSANLDAEHDDIEYKHFPRVRREERVFSGTRGHQPQNARHIGYNQRWRHHHEKWGTVGSERMRSSRRRRRVRWALTVGAGAAATAYLIGAAAEREEKREVERWERIVQGKEPGSRV